MRKKTAQPTRKHPTTSSSQPSGLIVNELKPGRSDGEKSALDDRSHRTSRNSAAARRPSASEAYPTANPRQEQSPVRADSAYEISQYVTAS